jgi:hypothetical protein
MSGQERGAPGLLVQFLSWVETRPRTYGETMDAWRTSCPRLSIWEDAIGDGLVELLPGTSAQNEAGIALTAAGRERVLTPGR